MSDSVISERTAGGASGGSPSESRRGGRLVRRTFVIAFVLVSGGLITRAAVELFFRYRESVESIGTLQREMAQGAAFKIQQFIQEIEKSLRAATQTKEIVTAGLTEAYRFELIKVLKIVPAIIEAAVLNPNGHEQIKVSRLRTILPEDLKDRSSDEAFVQARGGKAFFGPVYFVRESEPYMTIAVPIERLAGEVVGVLVAEVNLKYIWQVVSRIRVGRAGYAYVISGEGDLIAHPDISLVLQKRNLGHLDQVKAALAREPGLLAAQPNLAGQKVFPAYARIPALGWAVFVERPASEAYAPLYGSILRTSILLLVGLGMSVLVSLLLGHRVVRPLEVLRRGAARIGSGELDHRLEMKTGDEFQTLAEQFNSMTGQLQESYASLERKVEERTQELVTANQRLDEASRHKSQFLANVSHELRTPLNAIIGFTRLVLRKTEGQIPTLQKENLQTISTRADDLLNLINGLLDLSKIEAGRMEVFVESFKLDELVHTVLSTVEPMVKDGHVRLIREIAPDIPPLNTDREKLKQILLNLLSNAAKFTEDGEIKISAWRENGTLKLVVSDTGIGMKKEVLDHIFEEFRQADMSSTRKYGGTGLGLAITKRFVNLLSGDISVESEVGKGTTFTITLPASLDGQSIKE